MGHSAHRRRPYRALAMGLVVLTVAALLVPVSSASAATTLAPIGGLQWQGYTGRGWGPCAQLEIRPNPKAIEDIDKFRSDLQLAVDMINATAGRVVYRVGADTTLTADNGDRVLVLETRDGVAGFNMVRWDGRGQITRGDVVIGGGVYATQHSYAPDSGLEAITHELVHVLGLIHVADVREIVSYGFDLDSLRDRQDLGPGTTQALRHLYSGDCASDPVITDAPFTLPAVAPFKNPNLPYQIWDDSLIEGGVTDLIHASDRMLSRGLYDDDLGEPVDRYERLVVCRVDVFADCLGGSALAGEKGAVYYVPGGPDGELPDSLAYHAEYTLTDETEVYVLGGVNAVSQQIEDGLREHLPQVTRLAGASRIETAAAVADELVRLRGGSVDTAIVARADNPADAVTVGAVAALKGLPILLSWSDRLPTVSQAALRRTGASHAVLLGGLGALSSEVDRGVRQAGLETSRAAGRDRTETSVGIAVHPRLWSRGQVTDSVTTYLTNGYAEDAWALALLAAPFAARERAVILLTAPDDIPLRQATPEWPGGPGWYLLQLDGASDLERMDGVHYFRRIGNDTWDNEHVVETAIVLFQYCANYSGDCGNAQS